MLFQKPDDMGAGRLFDLQTADVGAVNGVCIKLFEPFRAETVFGAPMTYECTFPGCFHITIAASVFLFRRRDRASDSFFRQRFPDKMSVHAGSYRRKQSIRHLKMTDHVRDIVGATAQGHGLPDHMHILAGLWQMIHMDDHVRDGD